MKAAVVIILVATLLLVGSNAVGQQQTPSQVPSCQYPTRPLNADGTCDNSDPCDPSRIKIDNGKCQLPEPVLASPTPPTTTPLQGK